MLKVSRGGGGVETEEKEEEQRIEYYSIELQGGASARTPLAQTEGRNRTEDALRSLLDAAHLVSGGEHKERVSILRKGKTVKGFR